MFMAFEGFYSVEYGGCVVNTSGSLLTSGFSTKHIRSETQKTSKVVFKVFVFDYKTINY